MDNLKLIPQVFFDIICRVVPGAAGIFAALLLTHTTWELWLRVTLGDALATESALLAVLIFLGTAYVVGQLLSPLAKLIQRIGELRWLKHEKLRWLKHERFRWLKPAEKSEGYDWLRLHHASAGDQCAKIRAEFTMHNGIAVVFFLSAAAYVIDVEGWRWPVFAGLVIAGMLAGIRGRTTRDTYNETVSKFMAAARDPQKAPSTP